MSKAIGIDLGTTNSCVATVEGGKPVVIANAEGGRTTPSVVAYTQDGQRLVGQVARRQAVLQPETTVHSVKRFVGRSFEEVTAEAARVSYRVESGPGGAARVNVRGKLLAPEEVSAQVLRKLAEDASAYLGETVKDVVVTVPAYFNDAQRAATKDAGRIAGLNVLRVVNEPTAAALAYGLDRKEPETVLVFDLGGGTFDVSILELGEGVCEVKATSGDTHLGGDDFDHAVVEWLAAEFLREQGIDLRQDRQAMQRLVEAAERAKCELSTTTSADINLPFITATQTGPKHLQISLTRARFDELTRPLVERCRGPVEQALADAAIGPESVHKVLMVGGSTRIPAVQELVRKLTGQEPSLTVNPDEAVALGAAVQAAILKGEVQDVLLLDVTPLSLGVETRGGVMTRLIERNTTIPCRRTEIFSTAQDDQPAVDVVVLQGEREMASDNRTLGQFKLEGIRKAPRGTPQIEVSFDIDANGILNVTAKDKDTGKEQKIVISGSTNLDRGEVDRMVRDAESHSADDKRRKDLADARNEADSLAWRLTREAAALGDGGPAGLRQRCEELSARISEAVKSETADKAALDKLVEEARRALGDLAKAAEPHPVGAGAPKQDKGGDDVIDADFSVN